MTDLCFLYHHLWKIGENKVIPSLLWRNPVIEGPYLVSAVGTCVACLYSFASGIHF